MLSEVTKKDFVGAYKFADERDLKLISVIFCDRYGDVHSISTEQLTKPQLKEVLTSALAHIEAGEIQNITVV